MNKRLPCLLKDKKISKGNICLLNDLESVIFVTHAFGDGSGGTGYKFKIYELRDGIDIYNSFNHTDNRQVNFLDDEIFMVEL